MPEHYSGLTRQEMEQRRLKGADLLIRGIPQSEVARAVGVSRTSTARWAKELRKNYGTRECLRGRMASGRPRELTVEQFGEFRAIYDGLARPTTKAMARAVFERFGKLYDPDHMGRIMHRLKLPVGTWGKQRQQAKQSEREPEVICA